MLEDYCWTLGYYLTLQNDGENDKVFPTFEKSITTQEDEADSHVSKVFSQCFSLVNKIAERYMIDSDEEVLLKSSLDEFFIGEIKEHKDLKAHGAKKHGIQILGDLLTVSIQDISMRGGWALKAFNTFFDYWVGSLPSNVRSGKMISGWRQVSNNLFSQFLDS